MNKIKELSPKEFRTMQLLQLDMIIELDRLCRKNNIKYCIGCGTLLGAVRHKGYIPWDDDADIFMLREEYEKFKKITNQLNSSICFFQDHSTDPEYLWGYGKLRRTGTSFIRAGQEHLKGQTGVFIDIFVLDDIPCNTISMIFNDFYCFCLRKILWSRVGKYTDKGIKKLFYNFISYIPVNFVYGKINKLTKKSRNKNKNRVRTLLFPSFGKIYMKNKHPHNQRYGMPKSWFLERDEYTFEGHRFYGPKDYNAFLIYMYGNYMTLPPKEQRTPHAPVSSYNFNVNSNSVSQKL